jgi:hypothetical protein
MDVRTFALALALAPAPASAGELTCETRGEYTHCWNQRGETVTTVWDHNGRDTIIPNNRDHAIPEKR